MKKLLFSLTAKDFEVQTFCTGGNGGQHRNAKRNGVRIIHPKSGATAEHRDGRDQGKNREAAFNKLVNTEVFKKWHKAEVARRLGKEKLIEELVESMMDSKNIKVEVLNDETKKWETTCICGDDPLCACQRKFR